MRHLALVLLFLSLPLSQATAATALFTLAIGHNGLPLDKPDAATGPLSFADDDALAVFELTRTWARRSVVLALPDRATQARFPHGNEARPPTMTELRRALAELKAEIARAEASGDETTVWFFYSGHGWLGDDGRANLTLADGSLSQDVLSDEVLPALPGRTLHLMIDACHAEAIIRPRDLTAETVEVSAVQAASASLRARLERVPNVGAIMASTSSSQAHEWEEYQAGVFTHELLSGLRGAADVNGDGKVEYSEIAAFLAAANRQITDPRAHLTTLVVPPKLYPRAPILDVRDVRNIAHLRGFANHLGRLQIDDQRGYRLIDVRAEAGFFVDLIVPPGETILLSNDSGETLVRTSVHQPIPLDTVVIEKAPTRRKSAIANSMRQGLFGAEFGPSYYRGFVDSADSTLVPVEMRPVGIRAIATKAPRPSHSVPFWTVSSIAVASVVATGTFAFLAARAYSDFEGSTFEKPSSEARDRFGRYRNASIGTAVVAVVSGALAYWLWHSDNAAQAQHPIPPEDIP